MQLTPQMRQKTLLLNGYKKSIQDKAYRTEHSIACLEAASFEKEANDLFRSVLEYVGNGSHKNINWTSPEWSRKVFLFNQYMKAIRERTEISDEAAKNSSSGWSEELTKAKADYDRWNGYDEFIQKCRDANKSEEFLVLFDREYRDKKNEKVIMDWCKQCGPWVKSIRDGALLGGAATIASLVVPKDYLPPAFSALAKDPLFIAVASQAGKLIF